MNEFLHMGGYAAYVWPAYGIAALVLLGLLVATWKGLRNAEATLKALENSRPTRRRPRNAGRKPADQSAGTPAEASEG
ncbi:cytochrome C biogenesis protein CcmD [Azospirillum thiophilum]|uniref:Heme exporter protein D n=1 Tax=Azospirillum thiophilum TaxID=528244 RepID=A0AAC8VVX9_9PROT|nr:heme exporter protein CcmD [Azospirillum thiophilum]ALG70322.1 cytochrome C biogenesis protein CcmD [Azospirillum thiophilum]KJR66000.1 cytochrome C biogenesis protein CcmD [Azospirillum thiophilum]